MEVPETYTKEDIMGMDLGWIPTFLTKLGMSRGGDERSRILAELDRRGLIRSSLPSVSGWLQAVPEEWRGEIVALVNLMNVSGMEVLIQQIVGNYDYFRIQGLCEIIVQVTSDSSILIPEITRNKLVYLNDILCNSEFFWHAKTDLDFGITEKAADKTLKEQYKFLFIVAKIEYIIIDSGERASLEEFENVAKDEVEIHNKYLGTQEAIISAAPITRAEIKINIPMGDTWFYRSHVFLHTVNRYYIAKTTGKEYLLPEGSILSEYHTMLLDELKEGKESEEGEDEWDTLGEGVQWHISYPERAVYVEFTRLGLVPKIFPEDESLWTEKERTFNASHLAFFIKISV